MGDIWKQAITARIHSEIIEKKIKVPALCLSLEQLLAPCKKTRYKGKRPRPQNVFVIYRKEVNAQISATTPDTKFNDISKIASNKWKNENQHVKDFFTLLSAVVQLIHCDVFPDYQYKPMPTSRQKRPQHRKMSQRPWQKSAVTPHIWAEIYSIKEGDHHEHNRGCTHESIRISSCSTIAIQLSEDVQSPFLSMSTDTERSN